MKFTIIVSALAAATFAMAQNDDANFSIDNIPDVVPSSIAAAAPSLVASKAKANMTAKDPVIKSGSSVQDLRKPCDCPEPNCPPFLSAKARCECISAQQVACFKKSNGGCAEPEQKSC